VSDELPEGWARARIADVTERVANTNPHDHPDKVFGYVDISSIDNSSFTIAGIKTIRGKQAPSRARRPVRAGDTLFSNVRTNLRNVALVSEGSAAEVCSTGFTVLRPNAAVDSRYLFRYVLTEDFTTRLTPQQTGTHYPATSDRVVMAEAMPLAPIREQRRIVAKLEEVLGKVDACQKRLARIPVLLKRFRQSVLAAACSGRLTADWREAHSVTEPASTVLEGYAARNEDLLREPAHETPSDWIWVAFGALVATIRGGSTVPPQNERTEFPILRSSSVRPGAVDLNDVRFVRARDSQNRDNFLRDDDVLFTRLSGSLEYLANCAVVRDLGSRRIQYPDRVFCAKLKIPEMASYVELCFGNPILRAELTEGAKSSAGHQRVSIADIAGQRMPLPPLAEQREIARRVKALFVLADEIEARFSKGQTRVEQLLPCLLAKAFRGDLVPTEAEVARRERRSFEPASVLLDRIRGERAAREGDQASGRKRLSSQRSAAAGRPRKVARA